MLNRIIYSTSFHVCGTTSPHITRQTKLVSIIVNPSSIFHHLLLKTRFPNEIFLAYEKPNDKNFAISEREKNFMDLLPLFTSMTPPHLTSNNPPKTLVLVIVNSYSIFVIFCKNIIYRTSFFYYVTCTLTMIPKNLKRFNT